MHASMPPFVQLTESIPKHVQSDTCFIFLARLEGFEPLAYGLEALKIEPAVKIEPPRLAFQNALFDLDFCKIGIAHNRQRSQLPFDITRKTEKVRVSVPCEV